MKITVRIAGLDKVPFAAAAARLAARSYAVAQRRSPPAGQGPGPEPPAGPIPPDAAVDATTSAAGGRAR